MTFTIDNPSTALKAAFLWLLEHGSVASATDSPFPSGDADEPWSFQNEDHDDLVVAPCWYVMQASDAEPITEVCPAGWVIPLKVILYAPHGAEESWLRACVDEMHRQLHAQYHAREVASPADRTPLAWRLTSAAQEMAVAAPLWVHHTTVAQWRAFGVLGEYITAEFDVSVVCGMYDPE